MLMHVNRMQLNVMPGSCLDLCFERIMSLLLLYPRDIHDLLLCWSIEDTNYIEIS